MDVHQQAIEIADACARQRLWEILDTLVEDKRHDHYWLDMAACDPEHAITVDRFVTYLEARGLLERHPDNRLWVYTPARASVAG